MFIISATGKVTDLDQVTHQMDMDCCCQGTALLILVLKMLF
jgi:hypothetical protein